jgi:peptidoglycan/LPS O-acetylase OafA/YrhL
MTARRAHLDGWRGVAIGTVLVGHFIPFPNNHIGTLGVELFFVLSGLLMGEILFLRKFPLPEFFYRRISRIVPALWVFLAISWLALHGSDLRFGPLAALLAGAFLLNYGMVLTHPVGVLDHVWSLCVEEHAYLLLGLLAFLVRRDRRRAMAVIGGGAVLSMLDGAVSFGLLNQDYFDVYWRTDAHLGSIFAAAFLRLLFEDRPPPPWLTPVALAAGGTLFIATPPPVGHTVGVILLALSVTALDSTYPVIRKSLSLRGLTALGLSSYSIYLWQQPFYKAAHGDSRWTLPLAAAAIGVGALSYRLVEKPSRAWLNRAWPHVQTGWQTVAALRRRPI